MSPKQLVRLSKDYCVFMAFAAILVLRPESAAAQALSLSGATGIAGGTAQMNLSMGNSGGMLSSLQWNLQYSASSVASVTLTPSAALVAAGKQISCVPAVGALSCIAYGSNTTAIPDGSLAVVKATLKSTAATNQLNVTKTFSVGATGSSILLAGASATLIVQASGTITISSFFCDSTFLLLGSSTTCRIQLSSTMAANTAVPLTADKAGLGIPASVTIPAGSSGTQFTALSIGTSAANITITATYNGPATATLNIASFTVSSLKCTPGFLAAGDSGTCTVALTGPAPASTLIALTASSQAVLIPSTVTIPAGAISSSFAVLGTATRNGSVVITATLSGNSVTATFAVDVTKAFRSLTNAGGPDYTDNLGRIWSADNGFSGGFALGIALPVQNTTIAPLYQTFRTGTFSYSINVPNGDYIVNLKFAELVQLSAGTRVFDVAINGVVVLKDFDIFAENQEAYIATDRSFPVSVAGGTIAVNFLAGKRGLPVVSGIEIVKVGQALSAVPAERINAGGKEFETATDFWAADSNFSGGTVCSGAPAIANTTTPALYQTCRYGTFTYTVPVPNGDYDVTLKFAETIRTAAGQRLFDVTINGVKVLDEYDIFAAAGGRNRAVDRLFPVSVTGGKIVIQFTSGAADLALVNAIQIVPSGEGY